MIHLIWRLVRFHNDSIYPSAPDSPLDFRSIFDIYLTILPPPAVIERQALCNYQVVPPMGLRVITSEPPISSRPEFTRTRESASLLVELPDSAESPQFSPKSLRHRTGTSSLEKMNPFTPRTRLPPRSVGHFITHPASRFALRLTLGKLLFGANNDSTT